MTSETIAIQQTILIVTYICFLGNSQPSEGSNFGSLVGTFGQKSEMERHCDSHHWEATERGPKCDLFWRGFAKCSSFILLPVHTGSFVFPQTPSPLMNLLAIFTTHSLRPSSGKFRSFFHFRKVLQVNLFPSCVWIFYGLSGFAGFARHSHGSLLNCSTWFRFWNLYQTTLLLFEMKDITFQLLEETHFDLIFPIFSYLWSL